MYCLYTESGSAHWTRCYILQLQYFVKLISLQAFIGLILKIFDFTVIKNYVICEGNQKNYGICEGNQKNYVICDGYQKKYFICDGNQKKLCYLWRWLEKNVICDGN